MPNDIQPRLILRVIGDDGTPRYDTVAGLRSCDLVVCGDAIEVSRGDNSGWRTLLPGAGMRSITIDAVGLSLDHHTEERIRSAAITGTAKNFELVFPSGRFLRGDFLTVRFGTIDDDDGERTFNFRLQSAGTLQTN